MAAGDDDRLYIRELTERERRALRTIEERPGATVAELREELRVSAQRARKIVEGLRGRIRVDRAPLPEPADLEPSVGFGALPPAVVTAREHAREEDERIAAIVQTRIAGHIATYGMAIRTVEQLHERIADGTDIDLIGDSRWAAVWQLAGRAIGFAHALLVLANAGIGDDALPVARAMHEAVRLLDGVTNRHDRELVTRWLADDDDRYVRPREARAAVEEGERLVREMMIAAGAEPVPSTRHLSDELYHRMSLVAHNRRRAVELVIAPTLRRMARGRHPSPVGRAQAVLTHGTIIEEAVSETGLCMSFFLGPEGAARWLAATLRPTLATFEAVRHDQPLDEASLWTAVGLS